MDQEEKEYLNLIKYNDTNWFLLKDLTEIN